MESKLHTTSIFTFISLKYSFMILCCTKGAVSLPVRNNKKLISSPSKNSSIKILSVSPNFPSKTLMYRNNSFFYHCRCKLLFQQLTICFDYYWHFTFITNFIESFTFLKTPKFAVGILYFLHKFFVKIFEPSN